MLEAVPPSAEVIQEYHVRNIELLDECPGFHNPRKIRGAHAAIDDRACNAEPSSLYAIAAKMFRGLAREFLDD